jgi:hypothetical protein
MVTRRGKRLRGKHWKLEPMKGRARLFKATLLETVNHRGVRLAIFSVPKKFKA